VSVFDVGIIDLSANACQALGKKNAQNNSRRSRLTSFG
jgi:hypothetical protein